MSHGLEISMAERSADCLYWGLLATNGSHKSRSFLQTKGMRFHEVGKKDFFFTLTAIFLSLAYFQSVHERMLSWKGYSRVFPSLQGVLVPFKVIQNVTCAY